VALVSGAASGIGAATTAAFIRDGWSVAALDIDEDRLNRMTHEVSAAGGRALPFVVDVSDAAAVNAAVDSAVSRLGPLSAVCPNAGVAFPEIAFVDTPAEVLERLLAVNVWGVFNTLRATIPHIEVPGSVAITASISGLWAHPRAALYALTKMGLVGLTRSLAAELAPQRIRVNCVCPGGVDTPMLDDVGDTGSRADDVAAYAQMNPLGRIASPDDVANAILFLCSPAARHITGVALRVDGGDCLGMAL
jgi:NAD(P)-dependent dehydrogenase (short-subunit alcohol dehydrogenase family)